MKLSHLFSLSFMAAIFIGFALTTCEQSTAIEPPPVFDVVAFVDGRAFVLDSDMTRADCLDAARGPVLECYSFGAEYAAGYSAPTPAIVCAALLDAAQAGARDGYARAESNCGAIY